MWLGYIQQSNDTLALEGFNLNIDFKVQNVRE